MTAAAEKPGPGGEPAADAAAVAALGRTLLEALDRHLPGARDHADATATYAFAVAAELGASEADCGLVAETARLHDAGKLFLPSHLLGDSPPPAGDDRLRYEAHPEHCYRLLLGAGIPDEPARWLHDQCERIDGHGFPRALAAEGIARESRIIAAACAYDSVRRQVASPLALAELRGAAGTALDPDVVAALSAVVARVAS